MNYGTDVFLTCLVFQIPTHNVFGSLGHNHGSGKCVLLSNYHNHISLPCLRDGDLNSVPNMCELFWCMNVGTLPTPGRLILHVLNFIVRKPSCSNVTGWGRHPKEYVNALITQVSLIKHILEAWDVMLKCCWSFEGFAINIALFWLVNDHDPPCNSWWCSYTQKRHVCSTMILYTLFFLGLLMNSLLTLTAVNECPVSWYQKASSKAFKSHEEHAVFICVPEFLSQFAARWWSWHWLDGNNRTQAHRNRSRLICLIATTGSNV